MSIKEIDTVLPTTRGETGIRERRSVVKPRRWKRYEAVIIGTVAVTAFLTTWHFVAVARIVPVLFLPGPVDVGEALVKLFTDPRQNIWADLGTSGFEFGTGYVAASISGLLLGIVMGWYTRVQYALDPVNKKVVAEAYPENSIVHTELHYTKTGGTRSESDGGDALTVEDDRSIDEIVAMGFDASLVARVVQLVDRSEYKRRQSPPGIKITPRAFGRYRRLPIANRYRQTAG